jgi:hypothetical protein
MHDRRSWFKAVGLLIVLVALVAADASPQAFKTPETVLTDEILKALINEVSGQLAFNNEVATAGTVRLRTKEEFDGYLYEAAFLAAKLKEYGLDDVVLESLNKGEARPGGWWVGQEAELWMKAPDEKRLSRLEEHPALMTRGCDSGEWEGDLVYLDRRDVSNLATMDLKGKIILTPEPAGYFVQAYQKGALGVISSFTPGKSFYDPAQVQFDMRMEKGGSKEKAFAFNIWRGLGEELRDKLFSGQKVVLKATAKTTEMPFKYDTILATIRGTAPEKKGLMFTAHLFERLIYQGANDNLSSCVTLTEIARTITRLIREGRIPRPERSIYFLMSEEGSGTMAFFAKHPEMADRILADINMDMVGEDLEKNSASFNIELPTFAKMTFLEAVIKNIAEYVYRTNIEMYSHHVQSSRIVFPVPITEKNGSMQPFRYTVSPYTGGSDHGVFLSSDLDIPAFSFNVWPDLWYHTDRDRPDKSDPTQLKRVAFIGGASALAVSLGRDDILERVIRISFGDRQAFLMSASDRAMREISALEKGDGGRAFRNAESYVEQAGELGRSALLRIHELTAGKPVLDKYLSDMVAGLGKLKNVCRERVKEHYRTVATLKGYKPEIAKPTAEELRMKAIVPVKTSFLKLSDRTPYDKISGSISKDPKLATDIFQKYGYSYYMQLFAVIDGKRDLARIRDMLGLEFSPIDPADFMRHVQALEGAGIIKLNPRKAG